MNVVWGQFRYWPFLLSKFQKKQDYLKYTLLISTAMDRPCTRANLNRPITNIALDTSCTKTTSTPRAAKPGHAAIGLILALNTKGLMAVL